jgi:hypothetical protein
VTSAQDVWDLTRDTPGSAKITHYFEEHTNPRKRAWAWGYLFLPPTLEEIADLIERETRLNTMHRDTHKNQVVQKFGGDWAMSFLFHRAWGELGKLPLITEWWSWLWQAENRALWVNPCLRQARANSVPDGKIVDGMKWRIEGMWKSSIREIHVVSFLADLGVRAHFHPIVDTALEMDGWIQGWKLGWALYVDVEKERPLPKNHMGEDFTVHHLPIVGDRREKLWLVNEHQIDLMLNA